jgi:hypothetical protein
MIAACRLLLAGLAISVFPFIAPVQATDLDAAGGNGGVPYRLTGSPRQFLSGIAGRAGDFVDRLQLVCAPEIGLALDTGTTQPTSVGHSRGGHTFAINCPRDYAIRGAKWYTIRSHPEILSHFDLECASFDRPNDPTIPLSLNTSPDKGCPWPSIVCEFGTGYGWTYCPSGELAVGLYGRSGDYVDKVGLICARTPQSLCVSCHFPDDSRIARFRGVSRLSPLPAATRNCFRQSHWWLGDARSQ